MQGGCLTARSTHGRREESTGWDRRGLPWHRAEPGSAVTPRARRQQPREASAHLQVLLAAEDAAGSGPGAAQGQREVHGGEGLAPAVLPQPHRHGRGRASSRGAPGPAPRPALPAGHAGSCRPQGPEGRGLGCGGQRSVRSTAGRNAARIILIRFYKETNC